MELHLSNKKLRDSLADASAMRRNYGTDMAKKLSLRLAVLRNAHSLADFWPPLCGPERCHELKGELAGVFSIDLKQPYRLLFKPIEISPPKDRANEQSRWKGITAIEIVAVEDTHG